MQLSLRAAAWKLALGLAMLGGVIASSQSPPQDLSVTSVPDAVQNPQVSGDVLQSPGNVLLQWTPDSFADAGYNVYRAESPNGPWTQLNASPITDTFINDAPPRQAFTYYYVVFEVHADGSQTQAAAVVGVSVP